MDSFIHEDAKLAVKRGINWFDENHPGWASRIDLDKLDMAECRDCVIGQAVGEYSMITSQAAGIPDSSDNFTASRYDAVVWSIEHGFESPTTLVYLSDGRVFEAHYGYEELDTLWSDEVRKRLG